MPHIWGGGGLRTSAARCSCGVMFPFAVEDEVATCLTVVDFKAEELATTPGAGFFFRACNF